MQDCTATKQKPILALVVLILPMILVPGPAAAVAGACAGTDSWTFDPPLQGGNFQSGRITLSFRNDLICNAGEGYTEGTYTGNCVVATMTTDNGGAFVLIGGTYYHGTLQPSPLTFHVDGVLISDNLNPCNMSSAHGAHVVYVVVVPPVLA